VLSVFSFAGDGMVMRTMRQNIGILKWMVLVLILVFGVLAIMPGAMGRKDVATAAALVDGEPVASQRYGAQVTARLEQERQQAGGQLSEADSNRIRRDTLNSLIDEELALSHAKDLGQTLSPAEFQEAVMADPSLKDEQGRFDPNRYQRILQMQADQQGSTWQDVEDGFQRGMLLGKVRSFWASQAVLSPAEQAAAEARADRSVKVQALVWDLDRLRGGLSISDEDLHTYYSEHKQDWAKPEQLKLRQILVQAQLAETSSTAKARAEAVLAKLKAGADFKALAATENPDEATRKAAGDLGWLGQADMRDGALADEAFKLKPGQVSGVVQTQQGFQIVKVEGRKEGFDPTFANSKDKALKELGAQRAAKLARADATQALAAVKKGASAAEAAKQFKAALVTSGWFGRDDAKALPALGEQAAFAKAVLALDKGQWLDSPAASPKAVVIAQLSDEKPGPAPAKPEAQEARLRAALDGARAAKAQELYQAWLDGLRKTSVIKDQSGVLAGK
jgi:peptidyl-prolyl cis-trans isomerase D